MADELGVSKGDVLNAVRGSGSFAPCCAMHPVVMCCVVFHCVMLCCVVMMPDCRMLMAR
jgi:hypothetical protein